MEISPEPPASTSAAGELQIERSNSDASLSSSSPSVLLNEKVSDGFPIDGEDENSNESAFNDGDLPPPAPASRSFEDDDEEEDVCRICRNPGDVDNPLRYPCACSGSIKFVHQDCLLQWLNHSNARQCEQSELMSSEMAASSTPTAAGSRSPGPQQTVIPDPVASVQSTTSPSDDPPLLVHISNCSEMARKIIPDAELRPPSPRQDVVSDFAESRSPSPQRTVIPDPVTSVQSTTSPSDDPPTLVHISNFSEMARKIIPDAESRPPSPRQDVVSDFVSSETTPKTTPDADSQLSPRQDVVRDVVSSGSATASSSRRAILVLNSSCSETTPKTTPDTESQPPSPRQDVVPDLVPIVPSSTSPSGKTILVLNSSCSETARKKRRAADSWQAVDPPPVSSVLGSMSSCSQMNAQRFKSSQPSRQKIWRRRGSRPRSSFRSTGPSIPSTSLPTSISSTFSTRPFIPSFASTSHSSMYTTPFFGSFSSFASTSHPSIVPIRRPPFSTGPPIQPSSIPSFASTSHPSMYTTPFSSSASTSHHSIVPVAPAPSSLSTGSPIQPSSIPPKFTCLWFTHMFPLPSPPWSVNMARCITFLGLLLSIECLWEELKKQEKNQAFIGLLLLMGIVCQWLCKHTNPPGTQHPLIRDFVLMLLMVVAMVLWFRFCLHMSHMVIGVCLGFVYLYLMKPQEP